MGPRFLHVSSDLFADGMLPPRWHQGAPLEWWAQTRRRFFSGFHRCLPALASAGNQLLVDHLLESPDWREEVASLLSGYDVFFVGVHCELAELERREALRGDRIPGEARSHLEEDRVHDFGPYDLEVDTTIEAPEEVAQRVITGWKGRRPPSALLCR